MLKPKPVEKGRYWESVSDHNLLDAELFIDSPDTLPGIVTEIPIGDEEPYIEYTYDLRNTGAEKDFVCVHGHHHHLHGAVIRKGESRFLVGWICAASIYGENLSQYRSDFDAAVARKDALKRVQELKDAVAPFAAWFAAFGSSDAMKAFANLRGQIEHKTPWVFENLPAISRLNVRITKAKLPQMLCVSDFDIRREFLKVAEELNGATLVLAKPAGQAAGILGAIRARLDGIANKAAALVGHLREVEDFFQPAALAYICGEANQHDNPTKRKYDFGLLELSCRRANGKHVVTMPKNFSVPSARAIEEFRKSVSASRG